jgi:hypothetical protein
MKGTTLALIGLGAAALFLATKKSAGAPAPPEPMPCLKWVYYKDPVPKWATDRAVALLFAWNKNPSAHQIGEETPAELGGDGRTVRYLYQWHPPDPENGTPGGHRGVEIQYCADLGGAV